MGVNIIVQILYFDNVECTLQTTNKPRSIVMIIATNKLSKYVIWILFTANNWDCLAL